MKQEYLESLLYVVDVAHEHINGPSNFFVVDKDNRNRIQTVTN